MILEFSSLLTFAVASAAIAILPGPTVTVIIANSLKSGVKAGLLNVAGAHVGVLVLISLLALGLEALTTTLAWVFDWLRFFGAGYLMWLGYKLLKSDGTMGVDQQKQRPNGGLFWQGFIVVLSNPKLLLFLGAFLPQFVVPGDNTGLQTIILGLIFVSIAGPLDSLYALAAGRAGSLLTKRNVRAVEATGGSMMIGGGLWLAFSRN